jgi:hypothetical protein
MNSGAGLGSGWCRRCDKPGVDWWCCATIMVHDADRYAAKAGRAKMVVGVYHVDRYVACEYMEGCIEYQNGF